MSCWRVLRLSEQPNDEHIPQLLIKPRFEQHAYTVFLTDLTNIWSEELDVGGIIDRAAEEESPIEVSKRDTAQLGILLQNVRDSLASSPDTTCCITRSHTNDVTLHTTISLPEPLDSLAWKFHLRKRTAVTLKNELILPLLVSSHIQHERVNNLLSTIAEKDRAITRLVDQYESSNLDLAAAFPSIGGLKSGRRLIKREQAARHVPGLQPFEQESWKKDTAQLRDNDVSTLGLFQEALSECNPRVPPRLVSEIDPDTWWSTIGTKYKPPTAASRSKARVVSQPLVALPAAESATEEEETEDEFEVHEHFKSRAIASTTGGSKPSSTHAQKSSRIVESDSEEEEDDDDLDAPPKSQNQSQSQRQLRKTPPMEDAVVPEAPPPHNENTVLASSPKPQAQFQSPLPEPKRKGFRIGGKTKKAESALPALEDGQREAPNNFEDGTDNIASGPKPEAAVVGSKGARKGFKIGGKGKMAAADAGTEQQPASRSIEEDAAMASKSQTVVYNRPVPTRSAKDTVPEEEEREETAEEKAERKRRELKRKNEEAAKKLAQSKKKKRF